MLWVLSSTHPLSLFNVKKGSHGKLAHFEGFGPKNPATPPLGGEKYGSFSAACHYKDGSFIEAAAEAKCAKTNPKTGADFNFWHPPLVTFHMWIWYPNPSGVFAEFNPWLTPFNKE